MKTEILPYLYSELIVIKDIHISLGTYWMCQTPALAARGLRHLEDPFTGSATGGMAAYLWHYDLIEKPEFVAEQGHWLHRPGQARVQVIGPRDDIEAVKVGGPAVTIVRGELTL